MVSNTYSQPSTPVPPAIIDWHDQLTLTIALNNGDGTLTPSMATLTWVNGIGREVTDRQTATPVVSTLVSNWKLTYWRQLLTKYLQSVRKIMVNQVSPKNLYSLCCLKNYISIFICDNIEGLGCNNLLPWTKVSLLLMPINNLVKIEPTLALH